MTCFLISNRYSYSEQYDGHIKERQEENGQADMTSILGQCLLELRPHSPLARSFLNNQHQIFYLPRSTAPNYSNHKPSYGRTTLGPSYYLILCGTKAFFGSGGRKYEVIKSYPSSLLDPDIQSCFQ